MALQGGERFAQVTCQFLPANFPGHRPYCPYTAGAGGGRPWSAPDLARARRLIARSHTRGMRVTVLGSGPALAFTLQAREIEKAARPARIPGHAARASRRPMDYFAYIADSRNRAQIGPAGVGPRLPGRIEHAAAVALCGLPRGDPDATELLGVLRPPCDALIRRAFQLPADDAAADALWAAVDKRITDQAAVIPLIDPKSIAFVSRRVGNFQYSQQWGVLYDQLWVR